METRATGGILGLLRDLPQVRTANNPEVLGFISNHCLFGRSIGFIDSHLLASTVLTPGTRAPVSNP